jgi:hypothetical protein
MSEAPTGSGVDVVIDIQGNVLPVSIDTIRIFL